MNLMNFLTTNHTNQHEQGDEILFKKECYNTIIIEIKAVSKIESKHKAQLMNYLSATKLRLGLLVNFHSFPKTEIIRIAR